MTLRRYVVLQFALLMCLSLCPPTAHGESPDRSLLERILVIEAEFGAADQPPQDSQLLLAALDRAAEEFGRHDSATAADEIVRSLNDLIFHRLEIRATQDLKDPGNLLPSRVLLRKQGYCVGIAALCLLVAERHHLPIFAVATPAHVFLRYDDGVTRRNIETLQSGASIPDEQYVREQRIPEESIRHGVFMRNLTADEFLAHVHNNLGVVLSEGNDLEKAAREYERTLDLDRRLPAAWYNYGNDLLGQAELQRAVRCFSKSLRLYPTDVWALNNRGLAYLQVGKRDKARRDFEEALGIDPQFAPAQRNLASLRSGPAASDTP